MTKLKLYQCRVMHRGHAVHDSETSDERSARARVKRETEKVGIGARGTLYRVDRKHNDALIPIYEIRVAHRGKRGTPTLVVEHDTPPPAPAAPIPPTDLSHG